MSRVRSFIETIFISMLSFNFVDGTFIQILQLFGKFEVDYILPFFALLKKIKMLENTTHRRSAHSILLLKSVITN